jgi:hypothetical protein
MLTQAGFQCAIFSISDRGGKTVFIFCKLTKKGKKLKTVLPLPTNIFSFHHRTPACVNMMLLAGV